MIGLPFKCHNSFSSISYGLSLVQIQLKCGTLKYFCKFLDVNCCFWCVDSESRSTERERGKKMKSQSVLVQTNSNFHWKITKLKHIQLFFIIFIVVYIQTKCQKWNDPIYWQVMPPYCELKLSSKQLDIEKSTFNSKRTLLSIKSRTGNFV